MPRNISVFFFLIHLTLLRVDSHCPRFPQITHTFMRIYIYFCNVPSGIVLLSLQLKVYDQRRPLETRFTTNNVTVGIQKRIQRSTHRCFGEPLLPRVSKVILRARQKIEKTKESNNDVELNYERKNNRAVSINTRKSK